MMNPGNAANPLRSSSTVDARTNEDITRSLCEIEAMADSAAAGPVDPSHQVYPTMNPAVQPPGYPTSFHGYPSQPTTYQPSPSLPMYSTKVPRATNNAYGYPPLQYGYNGSSNQPSLQNNIASWSGMTSQAPQSIVTFNPSAHQSHVPSPVVAPPHHSPQQPEYPARFSAGGQSSLPVPPSLGPREPPQARPELQQSYRFTNPQNLCAYQTQPQAPAPSYQQMLMAGGPSFAGAPQVSGAGTSSNVGFGVLPRASPPVAGVRSLYNTKVGVPYSSPSGVPCLTYTPPPPVTQNSGIVLWSSGSQHYGVPHHQPGTQQCVTNARQMHGFSPPVLAQTTIANAVPSASANSCSSPYPSPSNPNNVQNVGSPGNFSVQAPVSPALSSPQNVPSPGNYAQSAAVAQTSSETGGHVVASAEQQPPQSKPQEKAKGGIRVKPYTELMAVPPGASAPRHPSSGSVPWYGQATVVTTNALSSAPLLYRPQPPAQVNPRSAGPAQQLQPSPRAAVPAPSPLAPGAPVPVRRFPLPPPLRRLSPRGAQGQQVARRALGPRPVVPTATVAANTVSVPGPSSSGSHGVRMTPPVPRPITYTLLPSPKGVVLKLLEDGPSAPSCSSASAPQPPAPAPLRRPPGPPRPLKALLKCSICMRSFIKEEHLQSHLRDIHGKGEAEIQRISTSSDGNTAAASPSPNGSAPGQVPKAGESAAVTAKRSFGNIEISTQSKRFGGVLSSVEIKRRQAPAVEPAQEVTQNSAPAAPSNSWKDKIQSGNTAIILAKRPAPAVASSPEPPAKRSVGSVCITRAPGRAAQEVVPESKSTSPAPVPSCLSPKPAALSPVVSIPKSIEETERRPHHVEVAGSAETVVTPQPPTKREDIYLRLKRENLGPFDETEDARVDDIRVRLKMENFAADETAVELASASAGGRSGRPPAAGPEPPEERQRRESELSEEHRSPAETMDSPNSSDAVGLARMRDGQDSNASLPSPAYANGATSWSPASECRVTSSVDSGQGHMTPMTDTDGAETDDQRPNADANAQPSAEEDRDLDLDQDQGVETGDGLPVELRTAAPPTDVEGEEVDEAPHDDSSVSPPTATSTGSGGSCPPSPDEARTEPGTDAPLPDEEFGSLDLEDFHVQAASLPSSSGTGVGDGPSTGSPSSTSVMALEPALCVAGPSSPSQAAPVSQGPGTIPVKASWKRAMDKLPLSSKKCQPKKKSSAARSPLSSEDGNESVLKDYRVKKRRRKPTTAANSRPGPAQKTSGTSAAYTMIIPSDPEELRQAVDGRVVEMPDKRFKMTDAEGNEFVYDFHPTTLSTVDVEALEDELGDVIGEKDEDFDVSDFSTVEDDDDEDEDGEEEEENESESDSSGDDDGSSSSRSGSGSRSSSGFAKRRSLRKRAKKCPYPSTSWVVSSADDDDESEDEVGRGRRAQRSAATKLVLKKSGKGSGKKWRRIRLRSSDDESGGENDESDAVTSDSSRHRHKPSPFEPFYSNNYENFDWKAFREAFPFECPECRTFFETSDELAGHGGGACARFRARLDASVVELKRVAVGDGPPLSGGDESGDLDNDDDDVGVNGASESDNSDDVAPRKRRTRRRIIETDDSDDEGAEAPCDKASCETEEPEAAGPEAVNQEALPPPSEPTPAAELVSEDGGDVAPASDVHDGDGEGEEEEEEAAAASPPTEDVGEASGEAAVPEEVGDGEPEDVRTPATDVMDETEFDVDDGIVEDDEDDGDFRVVGRAPSSCRSEDDDQDAGTGVGNDVEPEVGRSEEEPVAGSRVKVEEADGVNLLSQPSPEEEADGGGRCVRDEWTASEERPGSCDGGGGEETAVVEGEVKTEPAEEKGAETKPPVAERGLRTTTTTTMAAEATPTPVEKPSLKRTLKELGSFFTSLARRRKRPRTAEVVTTTSPPSEQEMDTEMAVVAPKTETETELKVEVAETTGSSPGSPSSDPLAHSPETKPTTVDDDDNDEEEEDLEHSVTVDVATTKKKTTTTVKKTPVKTTPKRKLLARRGRPSASQTKKTTKQPSKPPPTAVTAAAKGMVCPRCDVSLAAACDVVMHVVGAHVGGRYPCLSCPLVLTSEAGLKGHMRFHRYPDTLGRPEVQRRLREVVSILPADMQEKIRDEKRLSRYGKDYLKRFATGVLKTLESKQPSRLSRVFQELVTACGVETTLLRKIYGR